MFAEAYRDVLTDEQREALRAATSLILDEYHDDLATLSESGDVAFPETSMFPALPDRFLLRYSVRFTRQFLTCMVVATWKLAQSSPIRLSCVAEELAVSALIDKAKALIQIETRTEEDTRRQQLK